MSEIRLAHGLPDDEMEKCMLLVSSSRRLPVDPDGDRAGRKICISNVKVHKQCDAFFRYAL